MVPRWLVVTLGVFLALGHACELPVLADPGSHSAEAAHHHGSETLISCDGVGVPSHADPVHLGVGFDSVKDLPGLSPGPIRPGTASIETAGRRPGRPPLFLLHASLLI